MIRILGIDPGSRVTGYGVLSFENGQIKHLGHGVIDYNKETHFSKRISLIGQDLKKVMHHYQPDMVVIEKIFLGKNADSAFKLGHARGIAMYEAELAGAQVFEYATRLVKKGVTGLGAATKEQVQYALSKILSVQIQVKIDASDALALAYHHAIQIEIERKMARMQTALPVRVQKKEVEK